MCRSFKVQVSDLFGLSERFLAGYFVIADFRLVQVCQGGMFGRCIGGSLVSALYFIMIICALAFPLFTKRALPQLDGGIEEPLLALQQPA